MIKAYIKTCLASLALLSVFVGVTSGGVLRCPGCKVIGYVAEDDDNLVLLTNRQRVARTPSYVNVAPMYVDVDKVFINAAPKLPSQRIVLVNSRPTLRYRAYRLPSFTVAPRRRQSNVLSLNTRTRLGYY